MQLTEHFTLEEFEASQTAKRLNIKNKVPNFKTVYNLRNLCLLLETLRKDIGKPIIITSGYRCPKLNKAVGGVSNSQHMVGEACDFIIGSAYDSKAYCNKIFRYLRENPYAVDQCIYCTSRDGSNFIHLSSVALSKCRAQFFRYVYTDKGLRKTSFPVLGLPF